MRVDVLSGVNLDVLERRDPVLYGGLSLRELEQKIDSWAEMGTARARQTNSEGEYVGFCHDSLEWAEGMIVNRARGRTTATRSDALEIFPGPIVEVHLSGPRRARRGVAPSLRRRRPRGPAGPRTWAGRLPRCAYLARGANVNRRVDKLRENRAAAARVRPANVRYLPGLASSNAALLVDDERVQVFTDYRYAESARAVEGADFVDAKRDLFQTLSELLSGRIGFEAASLTFERYSPARRRRRAGPRRTGSWRSSESSRTRTSWTRSAVPRTQ